MSRAPGLLDLAMSTTVAYFQCRIKSIVARVTRGDTSVLDMADKSKELIDYIEANPPAGVFAPWAHYGADEDALMFYFGQQPDYARRVNSRVTVYLSLETDELVGCQIKGVHRVLQDIGMFDVTISHGRIKLKLVFLAMLDSLSENPETREVYLQLSRRAVESGVELEFPELV